jgi:NADPH:quinone reductase-like Zn-dependent oxidoreductase
MCDTTPWPSADTFRETAAILLTCEVPSRQPSGTQTAAGSTVARLVLLLAHSEGFRTVHLVRRRAQVEEITRLGGDAVICTEDEDWPQQLVDATDGGPVTAIDSVAGRVGATLAPGGRLLVFGGTYSERALFIIPSPKHVGHSPTHPSTRYR